jgi:uncharacterized protein
VRQDFYRSCRWQALPAASVPSPPLPKASAILSNAGLFPKEERNRVRRIPNRAHYDAATIYPILDEALICHVSFVDEGRPFIIPMLHARDGDTILLHGARASRLLKHVAAGGEVAIAVTLLDGLVVARSAFNSSANYRSAVLFGRGEPIEANVEKMAAFALLTERFIPGRWAEVRPTTQKELDATTVVAVTIELATAKVRSGPPGDDEEDYALPIWAGVLPLAIAVGAPEDDPKLAPGIAQPPSVTGYHRP